MDFGLTLLNFTLSEIPTLARAAESLGFGQLWLGETNADPFLAMTLAAEHTSRIALGTSIAVAFPRSPTTLAYIGHELTRYSNGRFTLGLGTQVRAHIERRFGVRWERPAEKMAATIGALRAIWTAWQTGERLRYRSDFFRLDLMTPFFSPAAHEYAPTPVFIAAVNPIMLRLAGEVCDGVFIHPLHTVEYLKQIAMPNIETGINAGGRTRGQVHINTTVFAIPTDDPAFAVRAERLARAQIAFYMSTPAYKVVTDLHDWSDLQYRLSRYARDGAWAEMAAYIPDSVMDELTVRGTWADLPGLIAARYGGLIDSLSYYLPFVPGEADAGWKQSISGFRALTTR